MKIENLIVWLLVGFVAFVLWKEVQHHKSRVVEPCIGPNCPICPQPEPPKKPR